MGLTVSEFVELAEYIQKHNSWENLYDAATSGVPVPKYYNVHMRIDTRDAEIWRIEFDTLTNSNDERVIFTDAQDNMKERIYEWLQTPANKKHCKKGKKKNGKS